MKDSSKMLLMVGLPLVMYGANAQAQSHPKPSESISDCADPEAYRLVASGPIGPWKRAYPDMMGGGYSDTSPNAVCGAASNAQPLTCIRKDGSPTSATNCGAEAIRTYEASSGGRQVATSYTSPLAYYSVAYADLGLCQSGRGTWRTTYPGSTGQCGTVTVPVQVQCVHADTMEPLPDEQCSGTPRPSDTTTIDDKSGCAPSPEQPTPPVGEPPREDTPTTVEHVDVPVPPGPPVHLLTGACIPTSSGGGRISCVGDVGEEGKVRGISVHVPTSGELCTGRRLGNPDGQTDRASQNWTSAPPLDASIPAQCAVSWRSGYSSTSGGNTSNTTYWVTFYYSGRPSGIPAEVYIGK